MINSSPRGPTRLGLLQFLCQQTSTTPHCSPLCECNSASCFTDKKAEENFHRLSPLNPLPFLHVPFTVLLPLLIHCKNMLFIRLPHQTIRKVPPPNQSLRRCVWAASGPQVGHTAAPRSPQTAASTYLDGAGCGKGLETVLRPGVLKG